MDKLKQKLSESLGPDVGKVLDKLGFRDKAILSKALLAREAAIEKLQARQKDCEALYSEALAENAHLQFELSSFRDHEGGYPAFVGAVKAFFDARGTDAEQEAFDALAECLAVYERIEDYATEFPNSVAPAFSLLLTTLKEIDATDALIIHAKDLMVELLEHLDNIGSDVPPRALKAAARFVATSNGLAKARKARKEEASKS